MQRVSPFRFSLATFACSGALWAFSLGCVASMPTPAEPSVESDPAGPSAPEPQAPILASSGDGALAPQKPMQQIASNQGSDDSEPGWGIVEPEPEKVTYAGVVQRVTGMVGDGATQQEVN